MQKVQKLKTEARNLNVLLKGLRNTYLYNNKIKSMYETDFKKFKKIL